MLRVDEPGGFCIVAGTTASGKSALALALAERCNGVIVNADSIQLYRSLPILTAQPTEADRERVPHELYGVLGDEERCSVAHWLELAVDAVCLAQPRRAVVVGGTGFYLEALLRGLPDVPRTPPALRQRLAGRLETLGRDRFAKALGQDDPELAARGLPQDPQRLLRAAEVLELTGRSIVSFEASRTPPALPAYRGGLALALQSERVRPRIERRLDSMLEAGALDELEAWRRGDNWTTSPLAKADGVREFGAYLDGDLSLNSARAATVVKVRRYAKRQRTWLRHRLRELAAIATPGEELAARVLRGDVAG